METWEITNLVILLIIAGAVVLWWYREAAARRVEETHRARPSVESGGLTAVRHADEQPKSPEGRSNR